MKKLLLSSIIMFGVCGIVTAQSATTTNAKLKPKSTAPVNSISTAAPQKSASAATEISVSAPGAATSAADVDAARSPEKVAILAGQPKVTTTTVNAAGEVIVVDDATKQKQAEKAAAARLANSKKTQNK